MQSRRDGNTPFKISNLISLFYLFFILLETIIYYLFIRYPYSKNKKYKNIKLQEF